MDRLQKLFHTKPDIKDGPVEAGPEPSLEVRDLTFSYPGTDAVVLKNVSFSLPAHGTLGIVGRTGSGKTTLVELLLRLYDPPKDTIFLGGINTHHMPLASLRSLFGYVPQETFLFALSIADNITFGMHGLSREEVIELAKAVRFHDEILTFPDGYDTLVGERGVTLSGGQKQRVAIARALAMNPRILVLDDALSSVDTETESAILTKLEERMSRCTTICVAHRIGTVRSADLILVLDDGNLVDSGRHQELLEREGYYAELYRMQQIEDQRRATDTPGFLRSRD